MPVIFARTVIFAWTAVTFAWTRGRSVKGARPLPRGCAVTS
ncbi:hypothetical protein [Nonomuraea dietziae]